MCGVARAFRGGSWLQLFLRFYIEDMSQWRASVIAWYYFFAWLGNCVGVVGKLLQNTAAAGTLTLHCNGLRFGRPG